MDRADKVVGLIISELRGIAGAIGRRDPTIKTVVVVAGDLGFEGNPVGSVQFFLFL